MLQYSAQGKKGGRGGKLDLAKKEKKEETGQIFNFSRITGCKKYSKGICALQRVVAVYAE